MTYSAKVDGKGSFEISIGDQVIVNNHEVILDVFESSEHSCNVIYKHRSFNVELVTVDYTAKIAAVKVNGTLYSVELKDQYDALLKSLGIDSLNSQKVQEVKAPMPGLVLNLSVKVGDDVKKGDNLLVLEAMKMENMIKSPTDGIIQKIEVQKGDKVEKNQSLIRFA